MKKLLLSTTLVTFALPALAQDTTPFRSMSEPTAIHGSELIGARVYALDGAVEMTEAQGVQADWQDIGEINDIVLSRSGQVEAVLVDVGGFLGIGERQVAVDMGALRFVSDSATADAPDDWFVVMTGNRALIEDAPAWEMRAGAVPVEGVEPAPQAEALTNMTGSPAPITQPETATAEAGTEPRAPVLRDGFTTATAAMLTADKMLGARVYDPEDRNVGSVSDLVIAQDGTISQVVLDIGGFLGLGAKPVALGMEEIDILQSDDGARVQVHVPMTKEQLSALPDYTG
ncbi:MAG TPA: PRC-barrel domain-containing protein [Paracoccaceae bacterium]|nr:PRC-barrel domain-containing protein [Paracoccaceae bacterium]HMO72063.1 PRC-barrel domain-containing protein [Paracoccaceae bacterium]